MFQHQNTVQSQLIVVPDFTPKVMLPVETI
jgi:hypothetical protein